MSDKLRIMFSSSATYLSTGYATYYHSLMTRLHETSLFDIYEYGSGGAFNDPRIQEISWKFMSALPKPGNAREEQRYRDTPVFEFGGMKFEEACLWAKPHVVFDARDPWMMQHEEMSPFRRFYHWVICPAVDAVPQSAEWLGSYRNADAVFGYCDWALDVLKSEGNGKINTQSAIGPGAEADVFFPIADKATHKQSLGISPDALVVGSVMRNACRKLFPDLLEAFSFYLRTAPEELARRTYLLLHTTYPDEGWDFPSLLGEYGLSSRALFTYLCRGCGAAFPSFFADARATCRRCGEAKAAPPSTHHGVSRRSLAAVINLMDCLVQYSTNEGLGMPQLEAAACEVPVFAVDYSAMSEVVRNVCGFPVRVERFFRDAETNRRLALPDNADLAKQLIDFLSLPSAARAKLGRDARIGGAKNYCYDASAKRLADYLSSLDIKDNWGAATRRIVSRFDAPDGLNDSDFVRWCFVNVAGRPDLVDSHWAVKMTRELTWAGDTKRNIGREAVVDTLAGMAEKANQWEKRRAGGR